MKNKFITTIASLIAVLAVGTVQAAPKKGEEKAADAKAPASAPAKEDAAAPKRDTYPLYGMVVSLTAKTLTIKGGEGKENRTYAITKDTVFKNGDKTATAADVKVGAWVGGLLKKTAGQADDAVVSLNVDVKQKEAGEAKEPAKTEPKTPAKAPKKKAA